MTILSPHSETRLSRTARCEVPSYGPVRFHQPPFKPRCKFTSPLLDISHGAILGAIEEKSFSSVCELARATHLPPTSLSRRLINSLRCVLRRLHWVPHLRSDIHKLQHVELSSSVLGMPWVREQRTWHDIVTLDEAWLYRCTDHGLIWLRSDDTVPERAPHVSQSQFNANNGQPSSPGITRDSK
jgi:hypothetical protein